MSTWEKAGRKKKKEYGTLRIDNQPLNDFEPSITLQQMPSEKLAVNQSQKMLALESASKSVS